jgi:hypothetical protein
LDRISKHSSPSSADRRKWQRYEVNWPFQIEGVDKYGHAFWADGVLHDISARGSSGYCLDPPEAGTRVVISIKMPVKGENWVRYLAEIVRVNDSQPGRFVAVKFESARPVFYTLEAKNKAVAKTSEDNTAPFKTDCCSPAVYKVETIF